MQQDQVNAQVAVGATDQMLLAGGATQAQIDLVPYGTRPAQPAAQAPAAAAQQIPVQHNHHHQHGANGQPAPQPAPAAIVAPHQGFAFDNENRKWKLSMAGWEIILAGVAALVILIGVFFLGRANGPGEAEFLRLKAEVSAAEAKVGSAEAGKKAADALTKVATDQLQEEKDAASRFQKKWETCMTEGCGPKK
jgi:hypothetical protein